MPVIVFKKYLYKSTINDRSLVGEEIYVYIKFTHIIELNYIEMSSGHITSHMMNLT